MKLKMAVMGIVLVAAAFSGCIGSDDSATGTYRCTVDDGTLYLHNGEYEMLIDKVHGGGGIYGDYSIHEGVVLLKREFLGDLLRFKQDGRDLIDPDGDRWVRD